jgi:hypothetical protein
MSVVERNIVFTEHNNVQQEKEKEYKKASR